jgi:hypothetical protein
VSTMGQSLEEQLQQDAIGTAPSVFDGAGNMTVGSLVEAAADQMGDVAQAIGTELHDLVD